MVKRALSVKEFCNAFSVSRSFFYSEVAAKSLNVTKAGNKTLVAAEEADRWWSAKQGRRALAEAQR